MVSFSLFFILRKSSHSSLNLSLILIKCSKVEQMTNDIATLQNIADTLQSTPLATQRILAQNAGMSVGLMNAVLKRFVERGWIMFSHVNAQKLSYALTSKGIAEITARGKKFARRTFQIASTYHEAMVELIQNAKNAGKSKVLLFGESYIRFLLEYACKEIGMNLEKLDVPENFEEIKKDDSSLLIAGDMCEEDVMEKLLERGCVSLIDVAYQKEKEKAM